MVRRIPSLAFVAAAALASALSAQQVLVTYDATTDRLIAFSPVDGSVVDTNYFPVPATVQVSAIDVNGELWVSEQTGDRIVRYDACGNVLGTMGPTLAGGGLDNIRGMAFVNGLVYVTNDGTNNGATADSLVVFDPAGNYVNTLALSNSPSPFSVMAWQGDLLVASFAAGNDVHRYTTNGVSVGVFHDSTAVNLAHTISQASDGNVWCSTFTSNTLVKLDANTGAILTTLPASGNPRGIYELANGNLLWTNSNGANVYDTVALTTSVVFAGSCYQLNPFTHTNACHKNYGAGCHSGILDRTNRMQLFADIGSAKAALDGNAMTFAPTANGYVASWTSGVAPSLYVTPTANAVIIANADSTTTTITPSVAIPIPGGTAASWTVSSNGVLTAAATGNQTTSGTPTLTATATATGLAFYTWANHNPAETSSGKVKWEEIGNTLYVTFEGVEFNGGTPTLAPSTFQWQIDTTTGVVTMLWVSMSSSNSTSDLLVGCTLAGAGLTPVSQTLSAVAAAVLEPDVTLVPVQLSASPAPVINPSTLVTYSLTNVPEFVPGSGIHIATMFLSVNQLPAGLDLAGLLTTVPGCRAYLGSLDVDLGGAVSASSTITWTLPFSNTVFFPGAKLSAQGVALFDPAFPLPNGENGGFLLSNGVLSTTFTQ